MPDNEDVEKARIAREARESVTGRPPRSGGAVLAALKRYLTSEQYRSEERRARRRPDS
jgi:hypothetical protein